MYLGEMGQVDKSIIRLLSSNNVLLHHYVAYAIERLLLVKLPNTNVSLTFPNIIELFFKTLLLNSANIPLSAMINALFECFKFPQAYETHYIMKALMRSFSMLNVSFIRLSVRNDMNKFRMKFLALRHIFT